MCTPPPLQSLAYNLTLNQSFFMLFNINRKSGNREFNKNRFLTLLYFLYFFLDSYSYSFYPTKKIKCIDRPCSVIPHLSVPRQKKNNYFDEPSTIHDKTGVWLQWNIQANFGLKKKYIYSKPCYINSPTTYKWTIEEEIASQCKWTN